MGWSLSWISTVTLKYMPKPALTLTLLLIHLLAVPGVASAISHTLTAKVQRVSDCDSIIAFTLKETKLPVRLFGIYAPEILHGDNPGQPYGNEKGTGHLLLASCLVFLVRLFDSPDVGYAVETG
jgi:hypothetical protein